MCLKDGTWHMGCGHVGGVEAIRHALESPNGKSHVDPVHGPLLPLTLNARTRSVPSTARAQLPIRCAARRSPPGFCPGSPGGEMGRNGGGTQ